MSLLQEAKYLPSKLQSTDLTSLSWVSKDATTSYNPSSFLSHMQTVPSNEAVAISDKVGWKDTDLTDFV